MQTCYIQTCQMQHFKKVKLGACVILRIACGCSTHFHLSGTLSLWRVWIHSPGTQGSCKVWVTIVYLPQVFLATHLQNNLKGRMNNWVSYSSSAWTALTKIRFLACSHIARPSNHYITLLYHDSFLYSPFLLIWHPVVW